MTENLQRSPLHEDHLTLGARLVPFAGWEMPVQYAGLMAEHHAVRQNVGVFDISHMGQLIVSGPGAEAFLNHALTNDISRLAPGHGHYTLLLNENGGVIDDLIAYRTDPNTFLLIVNAARITEDWAQLTALHAQQPDTEPLVELANLSPACAGLAIQGPKSRAVFATLFGPDATYPEKNTVISSTTPEGLMWLCGTGYTGEDGFEFFMPATTASDWFQRIVAAVQAEGGLPCGLGARDTLRLEMGYPLNGNDLSTDHTPLQAGLGFFVALNKKAFVGQPALLQEKTAGLTRKLIGFRMTGTAPPPRPHYPVLSAEGQPLGEICSGTLSPTLQYGIGMAYLPPTHTTPGTPLQIEIRGKTYPAEVTKKPFHRPHS